MENTNFVHEMDAQLNRALYAARNIPPTMKIEERRKQGLDALCRVGKMLQEGDLSTYITLCVKKGETHGAIIALGLPDAQEKEAFTVKDGDILFFPHSMIKPILDGRRDPIDRLNPIHGVVDQMKGPLPSLIVYVEIFLEHTGSSPEMVCRPFFVHGTNSVTETVIDMFPESRDVISRIPDSDSFFRKHCVIESLDSAYTLIERAIESLRVCVKCGVAGEKFQKCGGCKLAHYCGEKCQTEDWGLHKKMCK